MKLLISDMSNSAHGFEKLRKDFTPSRWSEIDRKNFSKNTMIPKTTIPTLDTISNLLTEHDSNGVSLSKRSVGGVICRGPNYVSSYVYQSARGVSVTIYGHLLNHTDKSYVIKSQDDNDVTKKKRCEQNELLYRRLEKYTGRKNNRIQSNIGKLSPVFMLESNKKCSRENCKL